MHTIYLFLWNKQSTRQSSNWRSLGRVWKGSLGQNKVSAALFVFLSFFLESKCDTSLYSLSGLKTANWVNMFFFPIKASKSSRREDGSWSLGLHDKKQLYMQKPVFDNFADLCCFCRHQTFGQQLIWVLARCEVCHHWFHSFVRVLVNR